MATKLVTPISKLDSYRAMKQFSFHPSNTDFFKSPCLQVYHSCRILSSGFITQRYCIVLEDSSYRSVCVCIYVYIYVADHTFTFRFIYSSLGLFQAVC